MVSMVLEDEQFKDLSIRHIKDIINYLLEKNIEFDITARVEAIDFNPELPSAIFAKLNEFSMFSLSNYTYTTIEIDDEHISFEAGFGEENIGSIVKIPYIAIFQIIIDESVLYINPFSDGLSSNQKQEKGQKDLSVSMQAILSNPKNKNIFKK